MVLKIKKLVPQAVLPNKAHGSDAGFDLVATSKFVDDDGNIVYGTGIAMEIPDGHVGLVFPRSSIAKKDVMLTNSVGVIDSGYRGEVLTKFKMAARRTKDGVTFLDEEYEVGDRIAQLIVMKLPDIQVVECYSLSESDRGIGGYGSSGK